MTFLSRAIAFIQASLLRKKQTAYDKFYATHTLTESKPNPASTLTQPRQPLRKWRYTGHDHGKKYTGEMIRKLNAKRGVGSKKRIRQP